MIEQFWLFQCARIPLRQSWIDADAPSNSAPMPMMGAVALHSERGPILVDAPFGPEGPRNVGGMVASLLKLAGLEFRESWAVGPRLESIGVDPETLETTLMTHLHVDHTGGMESLARSEFLVAQKEWDFAASMTPIRGLFDGYVPSDFASLGARIDEFEVPGHFSDAPEGVDLFGDGSVRAVGLPGHTLGHVGYRFDVPDGGEIFHVGDAAFTIPQIEKGHEPGWYPRQFAYDNPQYDETLDALRSYAEANPDTTFVNAHDFDLGTRCADGPAPFVADGPERV